MSLQASETTVLHSAVSSAAALLDLEPGTADGESGLRASSPSQRAAIESDPGPLLVLAGPGSGKTFCLIERTRFLIEKHGFDPARICAFTFTNKAAGEIAARLERDLGPAADRIKRGTIHAFCAELLREFGAAVGLAQGFGIADEEYQLYVLRRLHGPSHSSVLKRFSTHRFCNTPLKHDDVILLDGYDRYLAKHNLLDFDMLVLKTAEVLRGASAPAIRQRWDVLLVDEFQDLNPVQYQIIRELARDHGHVFAVGDDEQSIYSWAGADRNVFRTFMSDFGIARTIPLRENWRCPCETFACAQRLMALNTQLFEDRVQPVAQRSSEFPVTALGFDSDVAELAWVIEDLRRDRMAPAQNGVALLYRRHEIGEALEAALLNAGISCRLAKGRALAEEPVIAELLAALRVIANPEDDIYRDEFFAAALPRTIFAAARTQAERNRRGLREELNRIVVDRPRAEEDTRQVKHALTMWRNLEAIGRRHSSIHSLVQDLLSQRIGKLWSVLEENEDELTDPASHDDVVQLADRLRAARRRGTPVWIASLGGAEIPLKAMLSAIGITRVQRGIAPGANAECIGPSDTPSLGIALGVFKAAQLIEMGEPSSPFDNFTTIDLETTDTDPVRAEIVEVGAARVRNGRITETFRRWVNPGVPIPASATQVHGIRDGDVSTAPDFATVWPELRSFCGSDVIIAHNGYEFDFRILKRKVRGLDQAFDFCTYDSLELARYLCPASRRLHDLACRFAVEPRPSHRALDDAATLAEVFVKLDQAKHARARKTALISLLDQLGVALALSDETTLCPEAQLLRRIARPYALGRFSSCLDYYEREQAGDESIPGVDEVIEQLGGAALMVKYRSEKTAEERYPEAMRRLRRILAELPDDSLPTQLSRLLERVALSRLDGADPEPGQISLLTLHSTKGLEFSRVYIVGAEDAELPGGSPLTGPTVEDIEEARRLLYVGMTRAKDRLVLTHAAVRGGKPTGGHRFLDEIELRPVHP